MLRRLHVKDVAIIDQAEIEFDSGLTIITGETGAGKSLLIDSIELALGARADNTLIRTGCSKAFVQLLIEPPKDRAIQTALAEIGIEGAKELLIERELSADGRSTAKVDGRMITVGQLRSLGKLLVDLHGQHQHQSLLDPESQLDFLDEWIGEKAIALRAETESIYRTRQQLASELRSLMEDSKERERQIDILEFQVQEITDANLRLGEYEEVSAELQRAQHRETLADLVSNALTALDSEDSGATMAIHQVVRAVESANEFDPSLKETAELARNVSIEIEELRRSLHSYMQAAEANPTEVENLAERIDTLRTLFRKYGDSEEEVLNFLKEAEERLSGLTLTEQNRPELEQKLAKAEEELQNKASELSRLRSSAAVQFAEQVASALHDLAMEGAVLEVKFSSIPVSETGFDAIEFLFSANKGESVKPLHKIASGGELSRVMLAVKSVSAAKAGVPTLVFDEVDAGLSGKAAARVGASIQKLATGKQVIVITHLPQIACRMGNHFHIDKAQSTDGRTVTVIKHLVEGQREVEVARLLAGDNLPESALANAKDLLQSAAAK